MKFDKSKVYTALNADEVKVGSKGYFADTLSYLEEVVTNEDTDFLSKIYSICSSHEVYRFHAESCIGNRALFYLVEEPKEESEPKEVAAVEWNNRPRIMKVWDDDYSKATKDKVIYIAPAGEATYPVIAFVSGNGTGEGHVCCYKHCAEIAATIEVKAEEHYRPYSNADEFIEDYKRRFCPDFKGIPAIWVKNAAGTLKQVVSITDEGVKVDGRIDYLSFLDTYTYPDGSPCGMEE